MKDLKENMDFEDFIKNMEVHKAPEGFTDKIMDKITEENKIASSEQESPFSNFLMIYGGGFIATVILIVFYSQNTVNAGSPTNSKYFDYVSSLFSKISLYELEFSSISIPVSVAFLASVVFVMMFFDTKLRSAQLQIS